MYLKKIAKHMRLGYKTFKMTVGIPKGSDAVLQSRLSLKTFFVYQSGNKNCQKTANITG